MSRQPRDLRSDSQPHRRSDPEMASDRRPAKVKTLRPKFEGSNNSRDRKNRRDISVDPVIPKLTSDAAMEFVKLIHTGIGPVLAVSYMVPTISECLLDDDAKLLVCEKTAASWYRNPLVMTAISKFNGGDWQSLEPERRLNIALDKHYAELAYFLYSHDYTRLEGVDLKKANDARNAIVERLTGKDNPDSPFEKAIRDIAEKMKIAPQDLGGAVAPIAKGQH